MTNHPASSPPADHHASHIPAAAATEDRLLLAPISPEPLLDLAITEPPVKEQPRVGKTFIFAFGFAYFGFWIACLMPGVVTLALKVQALVGGDAAPAALGLIAGVGVLLPLVLMPIVGRMSDRTTARIGMRRPYLIAGAIAVVILGVVMGLAPNIPVLLAAYAMYSVAANFIGTPLLAVIPDQVPMQQRGLVSGLVGMTLPMAMIVGTFIIQAVSTVTLLTFVIPPAIAAIGVVIFIALVKDRHLSKADRKPKLTLAEMAGTFWVNPIKHPDFGWAWFSRLLFVCAFAFLTYYQVFYLINHLGSDPSQVPQQIFLASTVLSIVTVITSMVGGRLSDFFRRRKIFVLSAATIYGVALVIASVVTGFDGFLLAMGIAGVGYGAFLAVDLALVADVLPDPDNAGKDMAVFNMSSTLANAIGPAIAPFILILGGGSYSVLFAVAGAFAILGGLAILPVRRVR